MALMTELIETKHCSFEEVVSQPVCVEVMVEEYDSIMKNNIWEVVLRLEKNLIVGSRWIYKVMYETVGSIEKYTTRFVDKGFSRVEGVKYEEKFSHVERYSLIKTILALVVQMGGRHIKWM